MRYAIAGLSLVSRRRVLQAGVSLALGSMFTGCNLVDFFKGKNRQDGPPPNTETPTPGQLIEYLNTGAARIDSIQVQNLDLEVRKGILPTVGLNGWLVAQKPRNFRMGATIP